MSKGQKITRIELERQGWNLSSFDGIYEIWVNGFLYLFFDPNKKIISRIESV